MKKFTVKLRDYNEILEPFQRYDKKELTKRDYPIDKLIERVVPAAPLFDRATVMLGHTGVFLYQRGSLIALIVPKG